MGNHKAKPIMQIIQGAQDLMKKWHELNLDMEKQILDEFYTGMGVSLPTAVEAEVREMNVRAQFATNADLSSFNRGISNIVSGTFQEDWPKVALDIISFASNFVEQILGSGSMQAGLKSKSIKSVVKDPDDPNKKVTFISAIYAVTTVCEASQWFTNSNFYATKYVMVVWKPQAHDLKLLKV